MTGGRLLSGSSCIFSRFFRSSPCVSKSAVSVDSIRQLRQRTGAPIAAVKSALLAEQGDEEAAFDHLRKLGANLAAKRADREASEGLIAIQFSEDRTLASIVELNSETDFVARTERFSDLITSISKSALNHSAAYSKGNNNSIVIDLDTDELVAADHNVEKISDAVAALGENIRLRRVSLMKAPDNGGVFGYVHGGISAGAGRIGVLVALEGESDGLQAAATRAAMHVAAASPMYLNRTAVPADVVAKEEAILLEAARADVKPGAKPKPNDILMRIVQGRMRKWYQQVVCEEQEMMVECADYSGSPRTVIESLRQDCPTAKLAAFTRFAIS